MRLRAYVVMAAATLVPAFALEPIEILRKVAESYRNVRSYAVEGTDVLERSARGKSSVIERRFRAFGLQPGRMRVEFGDGPARVFDGASEWIGDAETGHYTKKKAPWDSRGRRFLYESFYNYEGIADFVRSAQFAFGEPGGRDDYILEVTYELPGGIAAEVVKTYWIEQGTYRLVREISYPHVLVEPPSATPVKAKRTISFSKFTLNAPLDESLFAEPVAGEPVAARAAPDFTLASLDGAQVSLRDMRGRAVLLYFWATWCATCHTEMAIVEKLGREHAGGLVVLGINDEEPAMASDYLKQHGCAIRSLVDRWRNVYKAYGVEVIPASILIGRDGRIISTYGYTGEEALRTGLEQAGVK